MKMKKKILSAAVLAAMGAGVAQAAVLGTDGTGQVMLFPYYTVQGGETTLLSVTNTTDMGKLVKIRFREAYNSREVLDFNIYLSPKDVWTGAVVESGEGAGIVSNDNSCTVPSLDGNTIPFRSFAYDGGVGSADTGPQDITRTREGYVEIIEMGEADETNSVWDRDGNNVPDYEHMAGVPDNCAGIVGGVSSGWSTAGFDDGVLPPAGGLMGTLAIINVQSGTEISVNATALDEVYSLPMHRDTGTLEPTLGDADGGIDAVSAVMLATNVMNDFTVNPAVGGETGWIVTFPTKWGYADDQVVGSTARAPFTTTFDSAPEGQACEEIGVIAYDREEGMVTPSGIDFSPSPIAPGINLCYEVNVIQFGESNVLSAENTAMGFNNIPGNNGWVDIDMTRNGVATSGLPVIGFSASVIGNAGVGVGAAYGTSNPHAYIRSAATAP